MLICSLISMLSTLIIIYSYLFLNDVHDRYFLRLIIAVSDLLSSIGTSHGEQLIDTGGCWFQAIVTNVFELSSILVHGSNFGACARLVLW